MLDPHSSCPTLGRARLMASIRDHWEQQASLKAQAAKVLAGLDPLLAAACENWPLRLIESETGVPRSTASGRIQRHLARSSEAAA